MTFDRGAALTTATAFGHAETSNLGPTTGNGFLTRWSDDLVILREAGITDVRLTFDWARLQPKPGAFARDWVEHLEQILALSQEIGLRTWATLHDGDEPRWITNEGGFGDPAVAERWWPRFAEQVADRFGSEVAGWVPFAEVPHDLPLAGWRNTWATLRGGDVPVIVGLDVASVDRAADYADSADVIGISLAQEELGRHDDVDERLDRARTRMHELICEVAATTGDRPIAISRFSPGDHHDDGHRADHARPDADPDQDPYPDRDGAGRIVATFVEALDGAIDDGVDLSVAFFDPAVAGPDSPAGLIGIDRSPSPASDAYRSCPDRRSR